MSAGTLPRALPLLFNSGKPADEPARVARATSYNLAGIAGAKRNELFEHLAAMLERIELVKRRASGRKHDLVARLGHRNRRIERVFHMLGANMLHARIGERIEEALARRAKAHHGLAFRIARFNELVKVGSLVIAAEQSRTIATPASTAGKNISRFTADLNLRSVIQLNPKYTTTPTIAGAMR